MKSNLDLFMLGELDKFTASICDESMGSIPEVHRVKLPKVGKRVAKELVEKAVKYDGIEVCWGFDGSDFDIESKVTKGRPRRAAIKSVINEFGSDVSYNDAVSAMSTIIGNKYAFRANGGPYDFFVGLNLLFLGWLDYRIHPNLFPNFVEGFKDFIINFKWISRFYQMNVIPDGKINYWDIFIDSFSSCSETSSLNFVHNEKKAMKNFKRWKNWPLISSTKGPIDAWNVKGFVTLDQILYNESKYFVRHFKFSFIYGDDDEDEEYNMITRSSFMGDVVPNENFEDSVFTVFKYLIPLARSPLKKSVYKKYKEMFMECFDESVAVNEDDRFNGAGMFALKDFPFIKGGTIRKMLEFNPPTFHVRKAPDYVGVNLLMLLYKLKYEDDLPLLLNDRDFSTVYIYILSNFVGKDIHHLLIFLLTILFHHVRIDEPFVHTDPVLKDNLLFSTMEPRFKVKKLSKKKKELVAPFKEFYRYFGVPGIFDGPSPSVPVLKNTKLSHYVSDIAMSSSVVDIPSSISVEPKKVSSDTFFDIPLNEVSWDPVSSVDSEPPLYPSSSVDEYGPIPYEIYHNFVYQEISVLDLLDGCESSSDKLSVILNNVNRFIRECPGLVFSYEGFYSSGRYVTGVKVSGFSLTKEDIMNRCLNISYPRDMAVEVLHILTEYIEFGHAMGDKSFKSVFGQRSRTFGYRLRTRTPAHYGQSLSFVVCNIEGINDLADHRSTWGR